MIKKRQLELAILGLQSDMELLEEKVQTLLEAVDDLKKQQKKTAKKAEEKPAKKAVPKKPGEE